MLRALRNRSIALLWGGQAMSSIGDEIYRVALTWIAVGLIGADTGYLAAGQAAAVLVLSLIGGKWADRWDQFHAMIRVDTIRCALVLLPVFAVHFMPMSLGLLLLVALSVSGLSAFFDPALQAVLPRFVEDFEQLQAANGLMSTTIRLARVAGPGLVGLLTAWIPVIHFFTLDALSFAISAVSISLLGKQSPLRPVPRGRTISFKETLLSGFVAIRGSAQMRYVILAKACCGGAWALAYGLGLALIVRRIAPSDVRAFGLLIASYGVGNLAGALILGNLPRRRPALIMFSGYTWLGAGFVTLALSPNLNRMMLAAALAAIGGPMNDLPFVDFVQARHPIEDLPKIFRLRIAMETAATLLCMLAAPALFRMISAPAVIALCGAGIVLAGLVGLALYAEKPWLRRKLATVHLQ